MWHSREIGLAFWACWVFHLHMRSASVTPYAYGLARLDVSPRYDFGTHPKIPFAGTENFQSGRTPVGVGSSSGP